MTTPRLGLAELVEDEGSGYVTFNRLAQQLHTLVVLAVEDYTLTTPPVSPVDGQCWYVPVGATGVWAGQDKLVAQWYNGAWYYRSVPHGAPLLSGGTVRAYIDGNGDVQLL